MADMLESVSPGLSFSPKRRMLEHRLVKEVKKAIKDSEKFSKEEKELMDYLWSDYLLEYEHEFQRYHREYYERLALSN